MSREENPGRFGLLVVVGICCALVSFVIVSSTLGEDGRDVIPTPDSVLTDDQQSNTIVQASPSELVRNPAAAYSDIDITDHGVSEGLPEASSPARPTSQSEGSRQERLRKMMDELRAKARAEPDPTPIVVAETAEDRALLIRRALDSKGSGVAERKAKLLADSLWRRVPTTISDDDKQIATKKIGELSSAEFGVMLELREAVRHELASADLSGDSRPAQGVQGVPGQLMTIVQRRDHVVKLSADYFVDYSKYEVLQAAVAHRDRVSKEVHAFIESL